MLLESGLYDLKEAESPPGYKFIILATIFLSM